MNMRTFAVVLGALTAACCATANFMGCIVTDTGGVGGTGTGGTGTGGTTVSSSSPASSTSGMSSSSGTMCDMNLKCSGAITAGGDPTMLCAGMPSEMLYKAYHDCVCAKCTADCMSTVCAMTYMPADATCSTCVTGMCKMEADMCANDQ